jgi:hypothetical protein
MLMKKKFYTGGVVVLCLAAFVMLANAAQKSKPTTLTFTKDVAPILYKNCVICHRPGEMAPMSLIQYKEVRPWARSIREKVVSREMPPWFADPNHGQFANDTRLSPTEIATLSSWVEGGAKEGDAKDLPAAPKFNDTGWKFGQPDAVLTMTEEASIPADGEVPYKYFVVPTNFTEDKYVQFAEIKRGEPSVIHHVIVSVREPGNGLPPSGELRANAQRFNPEAARDPQRENAQSPPNQNNQPGRRGGNGGNNQDSMLVGWAPGMSPLTLRSGNAKLIKKGSVFVLQMHYTTNGVAAKDRSSIGLWFSKEPVEKRMITRGVSTDPGKLVIPAGDPHFESRSAMTFTEDAHIHSFMPHMHVRGKDFEYKLVYPDGTSKVVLRVPKYDFNWQLTYFVKEPIPAPKGSRLECVAHHDNSTNNKYNPDPKITVHWGDQTWEEMMIGWVDYTLDGQNLRLQSASNK